MTADRTALEAAQTAAKLRAALPVKDDWDGFDPLMAEAADAIDALLSTAKEADRMREALQFFLDAEKAVTDYENGEWSDEAVDGAKIYHDIELARESARALLPSEGTKT